MEADRKTTATYLIAIAGTSGSGKTELAYRLAGELRGATVLSLDSYYRNLEHLSFAERNRFNFDDPHVLDWELITIQVGALARGRSIQQPVYSFEMHLRRPETVTVSPGRFVIIEGLFALYRESVRTCCGARIFVETPDEVCFQRRLQRDVRERGRTEQSVVEQYETTVRPSAQKWVLPTACHADLVVGGDQPLDDSLKACLALIERKGMALDATV